MIWNIIPASERICARSAIGAAIVCAAAMCASVGAGSETEVIEFNMFLNGAQEVPPADTPATGTGTATLDLSNSVLSWSIMFDVDSLTSGQTAAHFHGPAPAGKNAGIQIPLPLGSPIEGAQTITPQQASDLIEGLWYVNIHTMSFPGGEIRGQVLPASSIPAVEVTQLSWLAPDGSFTLRHSNYGQLHLTMPEPTDEEIRWINAEIAGEWAVQNQPLIAVDGEGDVQTYTYDFAFPQSIIGNPSSPVDVRISLTLDQQVGAAPDAFFIREVPVQEHPYYAGSGQVEPNETPLPHTPAPAQTVENPPDPPGVTWERVRQSKVPGVAEQFNHCTPGAFARILAWMNKLYCLGLPEDRDEVAEIYDILKDADHMMTTKPGATSWADIQWDTSHPVWGKMKAGLDKFLEDHDVLGDKVTVTYNVFGGSQDADDPEFTPCDVFDALKQGKGVSLKWGYWANNMTTSKADRNAGHSITVVGAVKCGDEVTIIYRDDANGMDSQNNLAQNGDNDKDSGVKHARFTEGGPSGWLIQGHRWEGFVTVCPTIETMIDAITKWVLQSVEDIGQVQQDLDAGDEPSQELLAEIQTSACNIIDIVCSLLSNLEELVQENPDCANTLEIVQRLKSKANTLKILSQFLREEPSQNTINNLLSIIQEMQMQLDGLSSKLDECLSPPPGDVGDLNGDGFVNGADLAILLANWGACENPDDCPADLNGSGVVDGADLAILLANWTG